MHLLRCEQAPACSCCILDKSERAQDRLSWTNTTATGARGGKLSREHTPFVLLVKALDLPAHDLLLKALAHLPELRLLLRMNLVCALSLVLNGLQRRSDVE